MTVFSSVSSKVLVSVLLVLFFSLSTPTTAAWTPAPEGLSGEIISCNACILNKLPVLKSFLIGGEAQSYEGIQVTFIRGRQPVLTVYEDGKEKEKINLSGYKSKAALHELFGKKGFHKTTKEEKEAAVAAGGASKEDRLLRSNPATRSLDSNGFIPMHTLFTILVTGSAVYWCCSRFCRRRTHVN